MPESAPSYNNCILYVIGSLAVGGAERHVVTVAAALKIRGYKTSVFALSPRGPLKDVLLASDVPVHGFLMPKWAEALLGQRFSSRLNLVLSTIWLSFLMLRERKGIVHFFLPAAYIIGGLVSCLVVARVRIMSRRSLNHYQSKCALYRKLEHFLHSRMNVLVGNSLAVTRELESESRGQTPVRLIYNGIDADRTKGADGGQIRRELSMDASVLVFVIVANLIHYKGHADLLHALAGINQQLPDGWNLLCVGRDDGILPLLQDQAQTLGIGANVRWLGARMDVDDCLAAANVAVSASHEEGFSNAVLEAMLAGLPMVVTDVGGNSEAVVDGVTGYVVPPHAPRDLGAALLKLAGDAGRGEMGKRGRQRVIERFSMKACLDGYEALYDESRSMRA